MGRSAPTWDPACKPSAPTPGPSTWGRTPSSGYWIPPLALLPGVTHPAVDATSARVDPQNVGEAKVLAQPLVNDLHTAPNHIKEGWHGVRGGGGQTTPGKDGMVCGGGGMAGVACLSPHSTPAHLYCPPLLPTCTATPKPCLSTPSPTPATARVPTCTATAKVPTCTATAMRGQHLLQMCPSLPHVRTSS